MTSRIARTQPKFALKFRKQLIKNLTGQKASLTKDIEAIPVNYKKYLNTGKKNNLVKNQYERLSIDESIKQLKRVFPNRTRLTAKEKLNQSKAIKNFDKRIKLNEQVNKLFHGSSAIYKPSKSKRARMISPKNF